MKAPAGHGRIVDEMSLQWLSARKNGEALGKIASRFGIAWSSIAQETESIREADRAEIMRAADTLTKDQLQAELDSHAAAYWAA